MASLGQPKKYIIKIGDVYDDYKCIDITVDKKGRNIYVMKCQCCGKVKYMLGATVGVHKGTKHKSCGKGLGITYDKDFYQRWKTMRLRTSTKFWDRKQYYDRGINSDAFASFYDFFKAMYPSWKEHVKKYGEKDTSLERIDNDKPYSPDNCKWVRFSEQKGNTQRTVYFTVTNTITGEVTYHKNASEYAKEQKDISVTYIHELISKDREFHNKKFRRITKQEFLEHQQ